MKTMMLLNSMVWVVVSACSPTRERALLDTPTSGVINIAADESLRPVIDAEVKAFEAIYKKSHIEVTYVSEAEAVRLLLVDSVRLAVITRHLTDDESAVIRGQNIVPHDEVVARESIAVILNPAAEDSLLTRDELLLMIGAGARSKGRVVFDDPNSGIARYARDSILHSADFSSSAYALKSNEAVIDYVSKQKDAVGLIGGAWISDRDDYTTNRFLGSIRVAAIEYDGNFYQPFQAYIARRFYPLTREIIICSREPRAGLGSGFMSFVAGDKGQRVILKAGLLPVTMPIRLVEVTREVL
jgi:phosphate transport system substrate-binding protein